MVWISGFTITDNPFEVVTGGVMVGNSLVGAVTWTMVRDSRVGVLGERVSGSRSFDSSASGCFPRGGGDFGRWRMLSAVLYMSTYLYYITEHIFARYRMLSFDMPPQ